MLRRADSGLASPWHMGRTRWCQAVSAVTVLLGLGFCQLQLIFWGFSFLRGIKSILDWFLRAAAFSISVLVFWMTLCLWARDIGNLIMPSVHALLSLSLSFLPVPPVSSLSPIFSLHFLTKSLSSGSWLFHLHLPLSKPFPICLLIF